MAEIRLHRGKKLETVFILDHLYQANWTIKMIQKIFQSRWMIQFLKKRKTMYFYQIKRCSGPCVGYIEESE